MHPALLDRLISWRLALAQILRSCDDPAGRMFLSYRLNRPDVSSTRLSAHQHGCRTAHSTGCEQGRWDTGCILSRCVCHGGCWVGRCLLRLV